MAKFSLPKKLRSEREKTQVNSSKKTQGCAKKTQVCEPKTQVFDLIAQQWSDVKVHKKKPEYQFALIIDASGGQVRLL